MNTPGHACCWFVTDEVIEVRFTVSFSPVCSACCSLWQTGCRWSTSKILQQVLNQETKWRQRSDETVPQPISGLITPTWLLFRLQVVCQHWWVVKVKICHWTCSQIIKIKNRITLSSRRRKVRNPQQEIRFFYFIWFPTSAWREGNTHWHSVFWIECNSWISVNKPCASLFSVLCCLCYLQRVF